MRDKNHFLLSVTKSAIRMMGCLILVLSKDVVWFAVLLSVAEMFGLLEEVFDKR